METTTIAIYALVTLVIMLLTYVFVYKKNSAKIMDQLAFLAFWNKDDGDECDGDECDIEEEEDDEDDEDEDEN